MQEYLRLFSPDEQVTIRQRKVLLFVFRDCTTTSLPELVEIWEAEMASMWASIRKPAQYEASRYNQFFEVILNPGKHFGPILLAYEEVQIQRQATTIM